MKHGAVAATTLLAGTFALFFSLATYNRNLFPIISDALADPPLTALLPKPRLAGLAEYLRRCTQPDDRVCAAWFVPELYFASLDRAPTGTDAVTSMPWFARAA